MQVEACTKSTDTLPVNETITHVLFPFQPFFLDFVRLCNVESPMRWNNQSGRLAQTETCNPGSAK